jgi:hypothetical protein
MQPMKGGTTMSKTELRRHAMQLAQLLPDDRNEALAVLAFARELLDWTDTERSCQDGADIVRLLSRPRKSPLPTSYEVEPA